MTPPESTPESPPDSHPVSDEIMRLRAALEDLSADHQSVLHFHYREEMGVAEIARCLDVPAGTVKSRLFHAREQLKQVLERTSHERIG